jgi:hypothetical protein
VRIRNPGILPNQQVQKGRDLLLFLPSPVLLAQALLNTWLRRSMKLPTPKKMYDVFYLQLKLMQIWKTSEQWKMISLG